MLGWKVHTIKDEAISWLHPFTEGCNFALLGEGVGKVCGLKGRLWEAANQISRLRQVFLFDSFLVGHHDNFGILTRLWET